MFASLVPVNNLTDNSVAGERMFTRDNFAIFIRVQDPDAFQGLPLQVVLDQDINDVNFNFSQVNFNSFTVNMEEILSSVSITSELFRIFQENAPPNELPRLIYIVYDVSSPLFQDPTPGNNATGGIILSVRQSQPTLVQLQSAVAPTDLSELVEFQFQATRVIIILFLSMLGWV